MNYEEVEENLVEIPVDFYGITVTQEERELLEEHGITSLEHLCEQTFKTVSGYLTSKGARGIQNQLIERGLDFFNSRRVSLKTSNC